MSLKDSPPTIAKPTKIDRVLGDDLLPRAADLELARSLRAELAPIIDVLRSDVASYATMADRARLARHLIWHAELELLQGEAAGAPADLEEAIILLSVDDRESPMMLASARQAWASILRGDAIGAAEVLLFILSTDDVTVRGWADQFYLWLAAAAKAAGRPDDAALALDQAAAILRAFPKRDRSLVEAARQKLGLTPIEA